MLRPGKGAIVTAVVVVVIIILGYRLANATRTYTYRTDYATLPTDDSALLVWIESHPGVWGSSVSREGNTVVVVFVRSEWGRDPLPDVHVEDERFGYQGRRSFTTVLKGGW